MESRFFNEERSKLKLTEKRNISSQDSSMKNLSRQCLLLNMVWSEKHSGSKKRS